MLLLVGQVGTVGKAESTSLPGVRIPSLAQTSLAARAGLQEGDVILGVNDTQLSAAAGEVGTQPSAAPGGVGTSHQQRLVGAQLSAAPSGWVHSRQQCLVGWIQAISSDWWVGA